MPRAVPHVAQAADLVREAQEYLKRQTEAALESCRILPAGGQQAADTESIMLQVQYFRRIDPFLQKQVLLDVLQRLTEARRDITAEHIGQLDDFVYTPDGWHGEKQIHLPTLRAVRCYDSVFSPGGQSSPEDCRRVRPHYTADRNFSSQRKHPEVSSAGHLGDGEGERSFLGKNSQKTMYEMV